MIALQLELIYGRAGTGKSQLCLDEIRQELRNSPDGTPLLLLVPEHATFKLEKELASTKDLGGFTRAYVMGFRRFAHRVLLELGGALKPRISDLGKRLLVHRILSARESEFSAFARAAKQRNFTETIVNLIEEFKSYRIESAAIYSASQQVNDVMLKQKLTDLSLIYTDFADYMDGKYTDAEDCLNLLAEKLSLSSLVRGAKVWIDGFTWFNPQELAILRQLLLTAAEVKITLCIEEIDSSVHQQEVALFHRQWQTRQDVMQIARELDVHVKEREMSGRYRFAAAEELENLEEKLVTAKKIQIKSAGKINMVEAANRRKEVEGMAIDMIQKCRELNYRWRDMAVLLRDTENYSDLIAHVFSDLEIPFFRDGKRKAVHHPLAEFLRSILDALQGWRYEPLFRVLKTGFFSVKRDQIDKVENYVLMYGVQGKKWQEEWQFGKGANFTEEALAEINAIRKTLIVPLNALQEKLKSCQTVSEYTDALYDTLESMEILEQLITLADQAQADGQLAEAREYEQLWNLIINLFDQLVETCGEEKLSLTQYQELLIDGLEGLELSLIPASLDFVTITTIEQNSSENAKAIYIVGINEGVLPKRGRMEGILNDAERLLLHESGLPIAPGTGSDNFAERFLVYSALTRASEMLWLSYPLADNEGNGLLPSTLIERIRKWIDGIKVMQLPLDIVQEDDILPFIGTGRQAVSALTGSLRNFKKTGNLHPVWQDVYNWAIHTESLKLVLNTSLAGLFYTRADDALSAEVARQLYAKHKYLRGSVTRFEKFTACPFRYFAEYGLKLKERTLYQLQSFDIGKFLHDVLRCYGEALLKEGKRWREISPQEQQLRCSRIVDTLKEQPDYMVLQSSSQNKHLLARLKKTVEFSIARLSQFDAASAFEPMAFEKSFGLVDGDLPPLTYLLNDGNRLSLTGQIDRIDCVEVDGNLYYLVMDYKTGKADVALIDVFYGLKLQLLTYLLAVQKYADSIFAREALPAAMLYCFLTIPFITESKKLNEVELKKALAKQGKMPGWALADADMLGQIDSTFNDAFGFIRFAVKKDMEFTKATQPNVKDSEEFQTLIDFVGDKFTQIGNRILAGDVRIEPYQLKERTGCMYCPYGAVCRFDKSLSCYQYEQLNLLEDTEIMEKINEEVTKWAGQKNN